MDQIFLVWPETGKEIALTKNKMNNTFPTFGPRGRISYAANSPDFQSSLVSVTIGGKDPISFGPENAFFARWSPNGEKVAIIKGQWPHSEIIILGFEDTPLFQYRFPENGD